MQSHAEDPAVQAHAVDVSMDGQSVLSGVELTLHPGELLVVVGPSGAGKTTLIHVLAALRPPDGGEVAIQGTPLNPSDLDQGDRLRRDVVGFMAQDLDLLVELSGTRNAALSVLLAGGTPSASVDAAASALKALGMEGHTERPARKLSRGQRQRVALARALAHPRPILLLDEPTASLDPAARDVAMGLLRERTAQGAAVLITTHDGAVAALADRVLHLNHGRLENA